MSIYEIIQKCMKYMQIYYFCTKNADFQAQGLSRLCSGLEIKTVEPFSRVQAYERPMPLKRSLVDVKNVLISTPN